MKERINIFWFRRDLRLEDNAGLYHALNSGLPVLPVFIFDTEILHRLDNKKDARVEFIHNTITELHEKLLNLGSGIMIFHSSPAAAFTALSEKFVIENVYTNTDYEPYAEERDTQIATLLKIKNVAFFPFKDQVIFEKNEVLKDDGKPYTVFTPYSKKWKATLTDFHLKVYPTEKYFNNFFSYTPENIPTLQTLGFAASGLDFPPKNTNKQIIEHYAKNRDIPGIFGTSHLGLHLRFGTISIRKLTAYTQNMSGVFLNELIWREFYQMILFHFPQVGKGKAFKPAYENITWRNNEEEFSKWCMGQTGYPIVDAGMRELNATGFMHNRIRMVTASFLCKHLLIDWKWGEAYFAEKLLDYDLAANNGGWQWVAGSGCDSAPYFRIFNPYLQIKKFDPQLIYIRKWVPEFEEFSYPPPMVDHEFARKRCLAAYKSALNEVQ